MKKQYGIGKRLIALVLCLAMLAAYLPGITLPATALGADQRKVDPSTMDDWKRFFLDPETAGVALTTENAGGIWTDKSVFSAENIPAELKDAISAENTKLSITDKNDNFLVALSAIASNKEIVGYSTIPTDTVFILDLSSSMRSNDADDRSAIDELVDATNDAIRQLLALNKNNRVSVVLYAGNTNGTFSVANGVTKTLLPLDIYTPNQNGNYLSSVAFAGNADWAVEVAGNVVGEKNGAVSGKLNTAQGTFMQDGIYEAMREFLRVEDTKVASGIQAGTARKPIFVLMTDGEPTMANNDYNGNANKTDLGTSNMHLKFNGQDYNHRETIAFMTQLTAAYARREVGRHYANEPLFYTLGFGEESSEREEARSVLDPAATSDTLNGFWSDFVNNRPVTVYTYQENRQTRTLTVSNDTADPLVAADKLYVDEFFYADPKDVENDLAAAFQSIVNEIVLQSKYYPTYVEKDHDHDGYITFTDKIGGYMDITEIKGIIIGEHYYSGATLSKGFVDQNSIFGSIQNPNAYGNTLVQSVKERLGIQNTTIAQQLLQNAYDAKQLSYDTQTGAFSNYIGWYSDENGNYLDFWKEGMGADSVPAGATHIVKSYGFLGSTDEAHGVSDTDMLFASVRVSKELEDYDNDGITGETFLVWQLPASLIPTITYQVSVNVDSQGEITDVQNVKLESDEVSPIRLVYEIALREDIHDWNMAEKVNSGYVSSDTNKDAGYVFYTNQWNKESDGSGSEKTTRNTYSHYEPSVQNERYYYTKDSAIYTDTNGTRYTGGADSKPSATGIYYRQFDVFEKMDDGTFRLHKHYERISQASLEKAEYKNGGWVIPKGLIHRYLYDINVPKETNVTDTQDNVNHPFIVHNSEHYYVYTTLGNNGKITATPATGIRLTKTLQGTVAGAENTFRFVISGGSGNATLVRLNDQGEEASRSQLAFVAGKATVTLAAGETAYIIDLLPGTVYTVTEEAHTAYILDQVSVDNAPVTGNAAVIPAESQVIHSAEFVNVPRGSGNLYITKEIVSDHDIPQGILAQTFDVTVHMSKAGSYQVVYTDNAGQKQELTAQTDENGNLKVAGQNLQLPVDCTFEILEIPEGTVVTVTENLTAEQAVYFRDSIKTRDHTGAEQDDDNTVTITRNGNGTAVIRNAYTPAGVSVDLNISGTKVFTVDSPLANPVQFDFAVQAWDAEAEEWKTISGKTASVNTTGGDSNFRITGVLEGVPFNKVGAYAYRVVELIPTTRPDGVIYDRTTHNFTVTVIDNNGALEATVTNHTGNVIQNGIYDVTFRNSYESAPVSVDVQKIVKDSSNNPLITPANFPILWTPTNANWEATGEAVKEYTDGVGKARFAQIYDTQGPRFYTVQEQIPAGAVISTREGYAGMYELDGWFYDPTVYYVKVDVTEQPGGNLVAVVQVSKDKTDFAGTTDSAQVSFTNHYVPDAAQVDLDVVPTVLKHLEGRALKDGEFTFYVVKNGTDYRDPANILLTGTNDAAGNVSFNGMLKFSQIGQFHLDVVEKKGDTGTGVEYDPTVYDLVVEVKDEGGRLTGSYYFEDSISNQVTFQNNYKAADKDLFIQGTKQLTGKPMLNGEFTFHLTQVTDESGSTPVQDGLTLNTVNGPDDNEDGYADIRFPAITYTHGDIGKTFYYKITEARAGTTVLGVLHSEASFVVKVTVSDNTDGTLNVVQSVVGGQEILFKNTYTPSPVTVQFTGTKLMEGRDLRDKEFIFRLTKTDHTYDVATGTLVQEVKNNKDASDPTKGEFTFEALTYYGTGSRYYVLEELEGSAGGVSYDKRVYHIHVDVTNNYSKGALEATIHAVMATQVENDGHMDIVQLPVSSYYFTNTYTVSGEAVLNLSGEKLMDEVTGAFNLQDELFTFVIVDAEGNPVAQTKNVGSTIQFPTLRYTSEDVGKSFAYTIYEEEANLTGVKCSQAKYHLSFTVDHEEGAVVLRDVRLTDEAGNPVSATDVDFVNIYEPDPAQLNLTAKKSYEKSLFDNKFRFTLTGHGENQTKENNGEDIIFDTVFLTKVQSYEFTVVEDRTSILPWVKYDPTVYTVTVVVKDNGAGSLYIDDVSYKADGNAAENVTFDNDYLLGEGSVVIRGEKLLTKKGVPQRVSENDFEFGLYKDNVLVERASTDNEGKFAFPKITCAEPGVTVYTVKEIIPAQRVEGMIYDERIYTVTVTATDNQDGTMQVKAEIDGATELRFTNILHETPVKDVTTVEAPEISIDGNPVAVGQQLRYVITYTNPLNEAVKVTITDKIPAHTSFKHADSNGVYNGIDTVKWEQLEVEANGTVTVELVVVVDEANVEIKNTATVLAGENTLNTNEVTNTVEEPEPTEPEPTEPEPTEPEPTEPESTEPEPTQPEPTEPEKLPALEITKTQAIGTGKAATKTLQVKIGSVVTYTLKVTNTGDGTAYGLKIADPIPQGLLYVKDSVNMGGSYQKGIVSWEVESLAAGESVELSFRAEVPVVEKSTNWINVGTVTYENDPEDEDTILESNEVEILLELADTPQTGDSFPVMLFVTMMILSSLGLAAVMVCKKQEAQEGIDE